MNVFEYLLLNNKERILDSKLSMVCYNKKPIVDFYKENKVVKIDTEHTIDDVIFFMNKSEIPDFDYREFNKNIKIYKKYPNLCLLYDNHLYSIAKLLEHLKYYKFNLEVPIGYKGIKYSSSTRQVFYVNKFTNNVKTVSKHYLHRDCKNIDKLKEKNVYNWMVNTNWNDYINLKKEKAQ